MSVDFTYTAKVVSPVKCNEKPWDLWVSEIGHSSPRRDDEGGAFVSPAELHTKSGVSRRLSEAHPYKMERIYVRRRRGGVNRLRYDTTSLHGLFPQMDNLNAAMCHMCGVTVKCSAAYRHLLESHAAGVEPILPPPPPAPTVKLKSGHSRSRHKKELLPHTPPVELVPMPIDTSPVHAAATPLSRIVVPQPDLQYLDEASTSAAVTGEMQVCVESGELPVVSIQDTDDLPLGENITDDIFAIMNSEGIESADDITNVADWKNIIRDIGNMQDINFAPDPMPSQEVYGSTDPGSLPTYTLTEADLSSIQFAPSSTSTMSNTLIDNNVKLNAQIPKLVTATTPTTKGQSRTKTSKSKFSTREYDPNKHCGVVTIDNPKPCTRSLTCKAHALSLRRTVEGRLKPFDTLLAEHRASRDPALAAATAAAATAPPPALTIPPSVLVNSSLDLSAFNGLTAEQQVDDIYASLLSVGDPNSVLPDTSSITSLLSQHPERFVIGEEVELSEVTELKLASPVAPEPVSTLGVDDKIAEEMPPTPGSVCWYSSSPRPIAICTFNTSHSGGAITLGKKFATVRSNIKSSLSRSQCKSGIGGMNSYYNFSQNSLSFSKTVHMNNASKCNKPEVRKLIVTCRATSGSGTKEPPQTFSELGYVHPHAMNGHLGCTRRDEEDARRRQRPPAKPSKRPVQPPVLDLGFVLDPLLADEKC